MLTFLPSVQVTGPTLLLYCTLLFSQSKVTEFLGLVSSTLQSYLAAYSDDLPNEESEEAQFILALCGIITSMCVRCVCGCRAHVCVCVCVCVCVHLQALV